MICINVEIKVGVCKVLVGVSGPQLQHLSLHHVDGLDLAAVATLNISCPGLRSLRFSGCSFTQPESSRQLELEDPEEARRWRRQQQAEEAALVAQLQPWLELDTLQVG